MLRIASIVLPKIGNQGESLEIAHKFIKRELCLAFGGYTALDSFGGWIADNGELFEESGITYQTACEPSESTDSTIRDIARHAGHLASQLAMFVILSDGTAEILDWSNENTEKGVG